jgi:DNA repair photolyase
MTEIIKGRGAQLNTANKFHTNSFEAELDDRIIEEDLHPNPKTQYFTENPKKILSTFDSTDLGNRGQSINPYQGCEHGCIYCYARNSHEYWGFSAGIDFETKIMVKHNAPALLEQLFQKKTWQSSVIEVSGNTDCYQPAEKKFEITRKMLQLFLKYRNPIGIITKNALVTRDIDILSELAKLKLVHIYISITSLDEDLRQKMEPRTVTSKQRLKVIEKLTQAGIPVGVMTAPIIPGLNNHEIPNIIKAAADHGALTAGYTVVRLNGAIGGIFEDWIHKHFPDRAQKVLHQIKECHGGSLNDSRWGTRITGEGNYAENIRQMHSLAKKKYMADRKMPEYDLTVFRKLGQPTLFG